MYDLNKGLKDTLEENMIPNDTYTWEITEIGKANDRGNVSAKCKIVEADDDELLGRSQRMVVFNEDTGPTISGQQVLIQNRLTHWPEDEDGERTVKAIVGLKFFGKLAPGKDPGRSFLNPVMEQEDYEWRDKLLAGEVEEDGASAKRGSKKKAKSSGRRR